jgi:hypothetical protein
MNALDRLLPTPRLCELDAIELAAPAAQVWQVVRHADLARSPLVRALFAVRTLPGRLTGHSAPRTTICVDDLVSSPEQPGFQVLIDEPPHEVAVGAVGQVWQLDIPFVHVADAAAFARFAEPDQVKVAWAIRVLPIGDVGSRVEVEVRVDATDEAAWHEFRRYFRLIGPGSRFIRRTLLEALARQFGSVEAAEDTLPLPGDELLPDAFTQLTHGITIAAPPERVWPWLLQLGCRRAGYYSLDLLDNAGVRSARELHPDLQTLAPGQVIAATPDGDDGFEVLQIEPPRALILGGLFDVEEGQQRPFASPRPARFWHMSWAFVLEPIGSDATRLVVRARGTFPASGRLHAAWIRPVHHFMESAQLRGLKARVEGTLPRDDWHDVLEGLGGAARIAWALLSPLGRASRNHWGLDTETAARALPGDALIAEPGWSWTHGVEIEASAATVWPWVAQIGATRGGFYSYQWLENLTGCELRNAEVVHPDWEVRRGDDLVLHPSMPPLHVVEVERGQHFVAHAPADAAARAAGKPWASASWLFLVEPLGPERCRFISRFRCAGSDDLATRLSLGPALMEPVGFAMDRRMLLGVKERAEAPQPR